MTTTQTENTPLEVATFLITKLLQKDQWISKDIVFQGLRSVGVPEDVINSAWYTAVTETDV